MLHAYIHTYTSNVQPPPFRSQLKIRLRYGWTIIYSPTKFYNFLNFRVSERPLLARRSLLTASPLRTPAGESPCMFIQSYYFQSNNTFIISFPATGCTRECGGEERARADVTEEGGGQEAGRAGENEGGRRKGDRKTQKTNEKVR